MTTRDNVFVAAVTALEAGISVVPPSQDGSKKPDGAWKTYQGRLARRDELDTWYSQGRTGVGWVTGAVSGGLEVIDFDDRSIYFEFKQAAESSGLASLLTRIESGYCEHSPNGAHVPYRCSVIAGNTKLAQRASDKKSLIETRGEGGFIIVAPTFGGVNRGGEYVLISGGIKTIATITPEERADLHALARSFDESPARNEYRAPAAGYSSRPGDEWSQSASWESILEPKGWVKVYSRGGVTFWRRPGKSHGTSATTNHAGSDLLYCFSSSTDFEAERGYGKFSAYAVLYHNGSHHEAARELASLGYGGKESPTVSIDLSGILSKLKRSQDGFPQELLDCPGLVGEISDYINRQSHRPQPIIALAGAIAAVATLIGRKVRTESGLRSNIYILAIGETGCGKEKSREIIKRLFAAAGAYQRAGYENMASDAAIYSAAAACPSCLFLLDEIGRVFKSMVAQNAPLYISQMVSAYLTLYSSSNGTCNSKSYAQREKQVTIEQPNVSIFGSTNKKKLMEAITEEQVTEGFLGRFLMFETLDPDPEIVDIIDEPPPEALVNKFKKWESIRIEDNQPTGTGNIERITVPSPRVIRATRKALDTFNDLEETTRETRKEMRSHGHDPGLYMRIKAVANKLALIRACSVEFDAPEITEADAEWGCKLAEFSTNLIARRVVQYASDNQTQSNVKRISEIIRKGGKVTKSDITRKTQQLKGHERKDALDTLFEGGDIRIEKDGKSNVYVWNK